MSELLTVIIGGLGAGALYALIALGLTLIYRVTGVVNFAQGEMATLATFVSLTFAISLGWPLWAALLPAIAFALGTGALIERFAIRALGRNELPAVVGTLGLFLLINSLTGLVWGFRPRPYPEVFPNEVLDVAGVPIGVQDLGVLGVSLAIMFALNRLLRTTKLGLAVRATANDSQVAGWMGIDTQRVHMAAWAVASVLGLAAGVLYAATHSINPNMMIDVLLKAFVAAVIGGLVSFPGAVVGGLALGVAENVIGVYVTADYKTAITFLLIIVVLAARPSGLLGAPAHARV